MAATTQSTAGASMCMYDVSDNERTRCDEYDRERIEIVGREKEKESCEFMLSLHKIGVTC